MSSNRSQEEYPYENVPRPESADESPFGKTSEIVPDSPVSDENPTDGMMPVGNLPGEAPKGAESGWIPYGGAPGGTVPYGPPPYYTVPYGTGPYYTVPHGNLPYGTVPYGNVPYGNIPYGYFPRNAAHVGIVPQRRVPSGKVPPMATPIGPVSHGDLRSPLNRSSIAILFWFLLAVGIGLVVSMAATGVTVLGWSRFMDSDMDGFVYGLTCFLMPFATLLAAVIGGVFTRTQFRSVLGFGQRDVQEPRGLDGTTFLNIAVIVLACSAVGQFLIKSIDLGMSVFDWSLTPLNGEAYTMGPVMEVLAMIGICIGAPLAEELLCRGVVLHALKPYGNGFAIAVSSLFFALMHGNPFQFPGPLMIGVVLGIVTLRARSIWPAVFLHAINNTTFSLLGYLESFWPEPFIGIRRSVKSLMDLPDALGDPVELVYYSVFIAAAVVFTLLNKERIKDLLTVWHVRPAVPSDQELRALVSGGNRTGARAWAVSYLQWQRRFTWFFTSWSTLLLSIFMTAYLLLVTLGFILGNIVE